VCKIPALCWGACVGTNEQLLTALNNRAVIRRSIFTCEMKRSLYHWNVPCHDGYVPFMHGECACNELAGLVNRHLKVVPVANVNSRIFKVFNRLCHVFAQQAKLRIQNPWSPEDVVNYYTGKRRTMYRNAMESLRKHPLEAEDARVRMFVKGDKLNPWAKGVKAYPRCIQYRGPRYCLALAQYVKPIDKFLFEYKGPKRTVDRSRLITKGLNRLDVGNLMWAKWSAFVECVAMSIDFSKMDAHCCIEILRKIDAIYLSIHGNDPHLRQMLSWRELNKARSRGGIIYEVLGTRMSGDLDTATGNCLISMLALFAVMEEMGIKKWDAVIDGDDVVLMLERSVADALSEALMSELYLGLGFEVTIEPKRYYRFEDIVYCQSKPVALDEDNWILVQDVDKVLSGALDSHRHYHNSSSNGVLKAIGSCYTKLYAGVPVLGSVFKPLADMSVKEAKIENTETGLWMAASSTKARSNIVSQRSRESFELAFGWPVAKQLEFERGVNLRWETPKEREFHILTRKQLYTFDC